MPLYTKTKTRTRTGSTSSPLYFGLYIIQKYYLFLYIIISYPPKVQVQRAAPLARRLTAPLVVGGRRGAAGAADKGRGGEPKGCGLQETEPPGGEWGGGMWLIGMGEGCG